MRRRSSGTGGFIRRLSDSEGRPPLAAVMAAARRRSHSQGATNPLPELQSGARRSSDRGIPPPGLAHPPQRSRSGSDSFLDGFASRATSDEWELTRQRLMKELDRGRSDADNRRLNVPLSVRHCRPLLEFLRDLPLRHLQRAQRAALQDIIDSLTSVCHENHLAGERVRDEALFGGGGASRARHASASQDPLADAQDHLKALAEAPLALSTSVSAASSGAPPARPRRLSFEERAGEVAVPAGEPVIRPSVAPTLAAPKRISGPAAPSPSPGPAASASPDISFTSRNAADGGLGGGGLGGEDHAKASHNEDSGTEVVEVRGRGLGAHLSVEELSHKSTQRRRIFIDETKTARTVRAVATPWPWPSIGMPHLCFALHARSGSARALTRSLSTAPSSLVAWRKRELSQLVQENRMVTQLLEQIKKEQFAALSSASQRHAKQRMGSQPGRANDPGGSRWWGRWCTVPRAVDPAGCFARHWDLSIGGLVIISIVAIPLQLAFDDDEIRSGRAIRRWDVSSGAGSFAVVPWLLIFCLTCHPPLPRPVPGHAVLMLSAQLYTYEVCAALAGSCDRVHMSAAPWTCVLACAQRQPLGILMGAGGCRLPVFGRHRVPLPQRLRRRVKHHRTRPRSHRKAVPQVVAAARCGVLAASRLAAAQRDTQQRLLRRRRGRERPQVPTCAQGAAYRQAPRGG